MPFAIAPTDLGVLVLGVGLLLLAGGWAWWLRRQKRAASPESTTVSPVPAVDPSALSAEQAAQLEPFEQAVGDQPQDPIAWYNRATTLDHLGQAQAALASYDRALELRRSGSARRAKGSGSALGIPWDALRNRCRPTPRR
jgi:tetratricopeptide (TPR) repeat protein